MDASEPSKGERTSETITGVSSSWMEERIRTKLEPLNALILTLTHLLNQLIQDNSGKTTPTTGPRFHPQAEPPLSREVRPSNTLPGTGIGSTGPTPNIPFLAGKSVIQHSDFLNIKYAICTKVHCYDDITKYPILIGPDEKAQKICYCNYLLQ